ncbi:MAG TPA: alpha/beta hydrolase [Vicinamibacterales bacterium]
MLLVSSRLDFWNCTEFSETDAIRDVVLEDPSTAVDRDLSEAEYLAALKAQRVLLLVHGYNNTEDDVNLAYARIERTVRSTFGKEYDVVTGYTWPGGAIGTSYPIARSRANTAGPRLATWIRKIAGAAKALDIMCHSLGARVVLKALEKGRSKPVRNLYLLAAAVDNEAIEKGEEFYDASKRCRKVVVMHSKHDRTLGIWFRIGDAILPWQWLDMFDVALGHSGPEDPADIVEHSPHVIVVNGKNDRLDHGDYKDHPAVYGFIAKFLANKTPGQFHTL